MNSIVTRLNNEVWATLAPSNIHGIGVIAIRDIPKNTFISLKHDNLIELDEASFLEIEEPIRNMILDRTIFYEGIEMYFRHPNSLAKLQCFMNHSDNPNTDGEKTLIDIKTGEELTEDFLASKLLIHKLTRERMKDFLI